MFQTSERLYREDDKKFFANVSNGQIVNGLDQFFSDYRDRRIRVHNAVWLVTNGIADTPEAELQQMIESWRKNSE